jgi:hypothetical protein
MKGVEEKIEELLSDTETLKKLLLLEKTRRGVPKESLVFVGMGNIAQYYWCAMQAVLKSRANELLFFASYLYDRISYSHRLGLISKLPGKKEALLDIGTKITFDDVQKLLREKATRGEHISFEYAAAKQLDKHSKLVMVINPDLPLEQRLCFEAEAKGEGVRIANPEEFPILRGEFLHTTKAEHYPTIRWNFERGRYAIVAVPDGITETFVYEFKTCGNKYLMYFIKPVALTQADLYGYFFKRSKKRVQIYVVAEGLTQTWEDEVDKDKAESVLADFTRVDGGWIPPAPKPWKCKSCEFNQSCSIRPR